MCKLGHKQVLTCLSFKHIHTDTLIHTDVQTCKADKHILPSRRVTYGRPLAWSVAHYISHYVFTHVANPLHLLRCDIPALCLHLLRFPLLLQCAPPSLHLTLLPSISHFSPYRSICLPVSLSACLVILPEYQTETTLLPRLPMPLCTRLPGDWSLWR